MAFHRQRHNKGAFFIRTPAGGIAHDGPQAERADLIEGGRGRQRPRFGGDERAQQRHFFGGEVAPVIPALDVGRHRGAARARLRSALMDQGSHAERSSGGRPPFFAQGIAPVGGGERLIWLLSHG